jgi:hypothetical protein
VGADVRFFAMAAVTLPRDAAPAQGWFGSSAVERGALETAAAPLIADINNSTVGTRASRQMFGSLLYMICKSQLEHSASAHPQIATLTSERRRIIPMPQFSAAGVGQNSSAVDTVTKATFKYPVPQLKLPQERAAPKNRPPLLTRSVHLCPVVPSRSLPSRPKLFAL